ncbi:MAG: ATP-binding cassette domain-containing protein, partial [candidate division Zixibacteria bacterium]|nr:ATP-binding cassette domain-containing protein [candidate division Zixibacteria bacterium]
MTERKPLFEFNNVHVEVDETEVVNGVSLTIYPGETHAIMGPNGSGKSSLANALMGNPSYTITKGEVYLDGENILEMEPDKRSLAGLFLAFQYP